MAVQNNLRKTAGAKQQSNTGLVEYESNGEIVKLSTTTIKNYLVSGGGNVTDQEVFMFLSLCRFQHLNPFLREAYLIKFGNNPAQMVVGKDYFIKKAKKNPNFKGKQTGIIILKGNGEIEEREGSFYLPNEKVVGGWAKVYIKDYDCPEYAAVSFEEYAGRKSNGELNNQWKTKPATMIRKVALVQALREAFPDEYGGLYSQEEMQTEDITLEETPVIINDVEEVQEIKEEVKEEQQEQYEQQDIRSALFN